MDKVRSWLKCRKYFPLVLASIPYCILAVAFPLAAWDYLNFSCDKFTQIEEHILYLTLVSVGLGLIFAAWVLWWNTVAGKITLFPSYFQSYLKMEGDENLFVHDYKKQKENLQKISVIITFTLSISTLIFFGVIINPQLAGFIGTMSVLFLAAASWVAFGSWLIKLNSDFKVPIISTFIFLALIISPLADNHQIRTIDDSGFTPALKNRPTVEAYFDSWLAARRDVYEGTSFKPVFIIAAEGGGIRAAYWTANLLAAFQDDHPEFADHVFALSGISGGSLGAALFVNLVKHEKSLDCPEGPKKWKMKKLRRCAHAILSEDFLAPTVASMLYPDLVQRINPFPWKLPDRAEALETSWEKAWRQHVDNNEQLQQSFLKIWEPGPDQSDNPRFPLPALFLNSTSVEQGKRIIISNVKITEEDFPDALDLYSIMCAEMPVSTAIHNSARFTYVSPAGTIEEPDMGVDSCRQWMNESPSTAENDSENPSQKNNSNGISTSNKNFDKKNWGHLVDGGYFENSGTTTAHDILSAIQDQIQKNGLVPVVITLINDPKLGDPEEQNIYKANSDLLMTEIISPFKALLKTRDGRGSYSRNSIRNYIEELPAECEELPAECEELPAECEELPAGFYVPLALNEKQGAIPLSWLLSDKVKNNIQSQVDDLLQGWNFH
ncbi:MAG: hypothetical protein GWM98_21680 [Nitrospinaceae bacterium]|nr:hypothetical protein [Nitrospinaceae bacterium]NIR56592.1 hypothetical protein [Nitrospinaceae bacterium]NIS87054.1 hypothetical protein [Nitrospinaceae bacterium]NIT83898.1 hypothetical protein [Nitrospinaceae bacterium]NIU46101.1 hypothetical protein [Nitrospinaceae bacterium]